MHDADIETIKDYVSSLDDEQIVGFVNNIKGIANEVYYVEAENSDGDTVKAYLYADTNHPGYDIYLYDENTNQIVEYQLKATDNEYYVQDAVDEVGSDHVMVTSELAKKIGLCSTGISNEQLEADVNVVIDKLIDDSSLWDYVPGLTAWSIALIIAGLSKRYANREITRQQFLTMVGVFAGAKAVKVALIIAALSIPGLNIVAGALLFLKMVSSVKEVYSIE